MVVLALRNLQNAYNSQATTIKTKNMDLLSKILPSKNDLTYERLAMRDSKISRVVFANRVLLALNGKVITSTTLSKR